jgi:3-oxoacyl-[acyl-carrier protein] reductase
MSGDLILNWSSNPTGRKLMGAVGLPTPQPLDRAEGPWSAGALEGRSACVNAGPHADVLSSLISGWGGAVVDLGPEAEDGTKVHALVFDATGMDSVGQLRELYDFFHPRIRSLRRCGRVVVLGRSPDDTADVEAMAARAALVGFTKSVAKELGRKGGTANLVTLSEGAEDQLAGPLHFLLSQRSAFISGQSLHVSGGEGEGTWSAPLAGKTVLVTGSARGIGEATARRMAAEGAKVVVLDIPPDEAAIHALATELGGIPLPLDITDASAADKIVEAAGGRVDVVVHNAGITRDKTLGRMAEGLWDLTLEVNLASVLRVTEGLLARGAIPRGGRIVLVSSVAGIAGNTGQTNYAASKAGIMGLTHGLGARLAPEGVAVNAVAPGFIETRLTQAIPMGIREVGRRLANLNQGGLPVDIAEAIVFLSSPGAAGLHGNVLRVCGGNLLGA